MPTPLTKWRAVLALVWQRSRYSSARTAWSGAESVSSMALPNPASDDRGRRARWRSPPAHHATPLPEQGIDW
ncbi:MAG: hypothetical protein H6638_02745 [Ardenticatenales bacterium]|nr:hypothetical protein [Ardenticatenales bacterium]